MLFLICILSVPPKISPFSFGSEAANYGDTVSAQCLVTSGDLPIMFEWYLNDELIREDFGITISKLGKRTSAINIDMIYAKHAGTYTCKAINGAATESFASDLVVNGSWKNVLIVVRF